MLFRGRDNAGAYWQEKMAPRSIDGCHRVIDYLVGGRLEEVMRERPAECPWPSWASEGGRTWVEAHGWQTLRAQRHVLSIRSWFDSYPEQ